MAQRLPGVALVLAMCAMGAGVAAFQTHFVGRAYVDVLVAALLLSVIVRSVWQSQADFSPLAAGAMWVSSQWLELSVALLGLSMDLRTLGAEGWRVAVLIVMGVLLSVGLVFAVGRLVGLHSKLAALVAAGNGICGNSAIAAVATAIRADKADTARAVALTAVFGLLLVVGLPFLIVPLGLNDREFGVLAGMSIYAVPQVMAAGFSVSQAAGETAMLIKLGRVALLGPLVLLAAWLLGGRDNRAQPAPRLPRFILAFACFMLLRTMELVPASVSELAKQSSHWLAVAAMAGLGLCVDFRTVRQAGAKVTLVVVLAMAMTLVQTVILIRSLLV